MVPLDRGTFRDWLDTYEAAWETGDPDAVAVLFEPDAVYHPTPFGSPLRGRDEIRRYWRETTAGQTSARVDADTEAIGRDRGVAHVRASFVRADGETEVDGMLAARFLAGDCVELREWPHTR